MGLADWFSIFCSNIQVQNGAVISLRYKAITRRLNTDFWETASDTLPPNSGASAKQNGSVWHCQKNR